MLMLRAEEGDVDEVKKLLNEQHIDVNSANKNGYSALALATKGGFYNVVGVLILAGGNVNQPNNVSAVTMTKISHFMRDDNGVLLFF